MGSAASKEGIASMVLNATRNGKAVPWRSVNVTGTDEMEAKGRCGRSND